MNRQRNRKRLFSSILCLSLALSGLTVPAGKVQAEDINEEKETEYASEPVEIYPWEAPTVKTMDFGTGNMAGNPNDFGNPSQDDFGSANDNAGENYNFDFGGNSSDNGFGGFI